MSQSVALPDGGEMPAFMNKVMIGMVANPLGDRITGTEPIHVLELVGRRSGKKIRTPIGLWNVDGQELLLAGGQWRWNFRDGHPVRIVRGRTVRSGTGTLVTDPEKVAETYHAIATRVAAEKDVKTAARNVGLSFPNGTIPEASEFKDVVGGVRGLIHLALNN